MANSSIFHGKRLQWLSKTISAWNTGPSDYQSRNLLPSECVFFRRLIPRRQNCHENLLLFLQLGLAFSEELSAS
jgi:hypothetical protein